MTQKHTLILAESRHLIRNSHVEKQAEDLFSNASIQLNGTRFDLVGLQLSLSAESNPQYHLKFCPLLRDTTGLTRKVHPVDLDRTTRFDLMDFTTMLEDEGFHEDVVFGVDLVNSTVARGRPLQHLFLPRVDVVHDPSAWSKVVASAITLEEAAKMTRDQRSSSLQARLGTLITPAGPLSAHEELARQAAIRDALDILTALHTLSRQPVSLAVAA